MAPLAFVQSDKSNESFQVLAVRVPHAAHKISAANKSFMQTNWDISKVAQSIFYDHNSDIYVFRAGSISKRADGRICKIWLVSAKVTPVRSFAG